MSADECRSRVNEPETAFTEESPLRAVVNGGQFERATKGRGE